MSAFFQQVSDSVASTASQQGVLPTFVNGLTTLAAVIVGAGASYFGTVRQDQRREERQEKQIASAFLGEIGGILDLYRRVDYGSTLRSTADRIEESGEARPLPVHPPKMEYHTIFNANAGEIGRLTGELPERLGAFYNQHKAIFDQVHSLEGWNSVQMIQDIGVEEPARQAHLVAQEYRALADRIDHLLETGEEVRRTIRSEYKIGVDR